MKRRNISYLIAALFMMLMCVSCSKTGTGDSTATSSGSTGTVATEAPSNFTETGYPIVNDTVNYRMMVVSDNITDPNEQCPLIQNLEELTNVHFDFDVVSKADLTTKKSLMWAGGNLPDIMTNSTLTNNDVVSYGPDKFLLLNDYIDRYMPNLRTVGNEVGFDLLNSLRLEDGNIYSLPRVTPASGPSYTGIFINKNWLSDLGLPMPKTIDEFIEALRGFRDNDMNGNGKTDDEIPFAWSYPVNLYNDAIFGWFGTSWTNWFINNGVVNFTKTSENYKAAVKFLNQLWKEKLLDPELFTQDDATFIAKGKLDPFIYGSFMSYRYGYIVGDKTTEYEAVPPLDGGTGLYGALKHYYDYIVSTYHGAISNTAKDPEILVRWLDVLYDPEYGIQVFRGPKDVVIEKNTEGLYVYKEVPEPYMNQSEWNLSVNLQQMPYYASKETNEGFARTAMSNIQLTAMAEVYSPYFIGEVMPTGFYTDEESKTLEKLVDIDLYVKQKFAEWVVGDRDIDDDWDEYVSFLEGRGANECTAAMQSFYNRVTGK